MPSDHLVFCPPAYFVIEEPSPARQRMDGGGIIRFEYRDGPDDPPRLMLVTKNGKASLHFHSASVPYVGSFPLSPCLMFFYLCLSLGRVPAAMTTIPSGVQTNIQPLRPFLIFTTCTHGMTTHDRTLTRIVMFVYFSPPNMPTSTNDDTRRERRLNWEHCSGSQRVRDQRGLAAG
jgi:hypothetical protein